MEVGEAWRRRGALLVAFGVLGGALAWGGLTILARPDDLQSRVAVLQAREREIKSLAQEAAETKPRFEAGAVCPRLDEDQLQLFRQALQGMASQSGAALDLAALTPLEGGGADQSVAAVDLQIAASGPYPSIVRFLELASKSEPAIFVDELDLTSRSFTIDLSMTGKVYCWIGR